ncbi:iron ABC transporter permease [Aureimonas sp. SA4125]|uniref:ABC transporter permease n=1 Tax=Aureimonas sp. SA4125 TaxID=2826993 RepID=UPI001CC4A887|nr:iron ABC transporter permease [Aureimonas sp. SA4125]
MPPPKLRRLQAAGLPLQAVAIAVSLLALVPLGFVAVVAVQSGWETVAALVFRARVGELLVNTALLELFTLPPAICLALALAWLTERTDLPGGRLWTWLAITPLAVPAFVHSYAWISVAPGMHGLGAAVLVSILAYFPFLFLPIAGQLRRLDPALEDAAAALGQTPWQVFFRVVVPQLRLAIAGGSLLVGIHLLAEYGLYVMIRFDTFTTAIVDQFQSAFNGPAANMMAGVLLLSCLALIALERLARGSERYARVGSGAPRRRPRQALGRATVPALALHGIVAALSLGVPVYTLARWLGLGGAGVWLTGEVAEALATTLALGFGGALLTTLLVVPMAWLSVRAPSRLQRLLEACHYYVGSLPGVVVALALVTITVRIALPLYQTTATLLAAYLLMFLPRALVGLRASIAQAPVELEQAAMALGRSPLAAIWQVTLRLAAPGAAASFALVALGITTELTATLMLSPNGTTTLATQFWSKTSEIDYVAAAPYAALMVLSSLPLTLLLQAQMKRSGRA